MVIILNNHPNEFLKPYGRKFGPAPASIKSAMVGGIVTNDASGRSCGIWANSDRLMLTARLIFADVDRLMLLWSLLTVIYYKINSVGIRKMRKCPFLALEKFTKIVHNA